MFLMSLALAAGLAAWQYRTANSLRTKLASAVEVANHNYSQFKLLQTQVDSERSLFKATIAKHNEEVGELFIQSERNYLAAREDAEKLLGKAAVWANHNVSRGSIPRSQECKIRLGNIDQFLNDYITEARSVEAH
jgi:hypothetical protein